MATYLAATMRHPNFRDQKAVELYLDDRGIAFEQSVMRAGVGIPVLRWSPHEAANEEFRRRAYRVLAKWIEFENEGIGLCRFRMSRQLTWTTNEPPTQSDGFAILQDPAELRDTLNQVKASIQRLSICAMDMSGENDDLLIGLLLVHEFMRRNGVDPDSNGSLTALARLRLARQSVRAHPQDQV